MNPKNIMFCTFKLEVPQKLNISNQQLIGVNGNQEEIKTVSKTEKISDFDKKIEVPEEEKLDFEDVKN